MRIAFVDIQNFRKLKRCRVIFSVQKTVFVGANNSGKTSAMDALITFLKRDRRKGISTKDFTLSNWKAINQLASSWIATEAGAELDLSIENWRLHMPAVDVWLEVENTEVHYVSHIIPTLDWDGGRLGVRLILEPKNVEELYKAYKVAYDSALKTSAAHDGDLQLWPKAMRDFLEKELHKHFEIKAYILDPSNSEGEILQEISEGEEPLDSDPFSGLIKIDIINAQRGFSDPGTEDGSSRDRRLSAQLGEYFRKHLNPSELPEESDLGVIAAIEKAKKEFDSKLQERFKSSIGELEGLNYPGFADPKIKISSDVDPLQSIQHDAAVLFNVLKNAGEQDDVSLSLPEKYNGLGYQNLISMIFNLIRFRDEWMRVGKVGRKAEGDDKFIEPLHIVLIEEPEAHLHAQVQQVFIKKAYDVLRAHTDLGEKKAFLTQLVISTHSSHIAHETDFVSLRYFKRTPATCDDEVPCAKVVNLSTVFGAGDDTARFATRYLKTTHCDLFFADASILIEGPAERMLIPQFISEHFPDLDRCYISLLEIGGSHAHRLKSLIETLGLLTLVITDLDSLWERKVTDEETGDTKTKRSKILPEKGKGYVTGNDTIKSWVPEKTDLDEVLDASDRDKVKDGYVRAAYPSELKLQYAEGAGEVSAIPYTFEDAMALENIDFFKDKTGSKGLIKKIAKAVNKPTVLEACADMFKALSKDSKKAEMALELLYISEPKELTPPQYIAEGLKWLEEKLVNHGADYIVPEDSEPEGGRDE
jgi:predicted ATP-dependent endonuclease of OLD family